MKTLMLGLLSSLVLLPCGLAYADAVHIACQPEDASVVYPKMVVSEAQGYSQVLYSLDANNAEIRFDVSAPSNAAGQLRSGIQAWNESFQLIGLVGSSTGRGQLLTNIQAVRVSGGQVRVYATVAAFGRVDRLACY